MRPPLVFEDDRWPELSPLADLTPVPELRLGRGTLAQGWRRHAAAAAARPRAGARLGGNGGSELVLAVNAAALPGPWIDEALRAEAPVRLVCGARLAAAVLEARRLPADDRGDHPPGRGPGALAGALPDREREVPTEFLAWPWDFVARNAAMLEADAGLESGDGGAVDPRAVLLAPERVRIEAGARVDPLAVLDARQGLIRIGRDVVIGPHTVVEGPCEVGERTQLLGGRVARSTIGPDCRIAGEVEECVFQGFANKRHHGFIGHSVIGEWVNLGALTTTSDLKNNYGEVRCWGAGAMRGTGLVKLGALIGAHVKTGIGTLLPTGGSIGVGANLFGGGRFAPRRVPAFGWWDGETMAEHRIEEMLATARTAASRRGRGLALLEESRLREIFAARGQWQAA